MKSRDPWLRLFLPGLAGLALGLVAPMPAAQDPGGPPARVTPDPPGPPQAAAKSPLRRQEERRARQALLQKLRQQVAEGDPSDRLQNQLARLEDEERQDRLEELREVREEFRLGRDRVLQLERLQHELEERIQQESERLEALRRGQVPAARPQAKPFQEPPLAASLAELLRLDPEKPDVGLRGRLLKRPVPDPLGPADLADLLERAAGEIRRAAANQDRRLPFLKRRIQELERRLARLQAEIRQEIRRMAAKMGQQVEEEEGESWLEGQEKWRQELWRRKQAEAARKGVAGQPPSRGAEPARPEPARPQPARPAPAQPQPVRPAPAQPQPPVRGR